MRFLTVSALALCVGGPLAGVARADAAFVAGVDEYDTLDRFRRGTEVVDAGPALADAGFSVVSMEDPTGANLTQQVRAFGAAMPAADRAIVVLAGRFATDGTRTWFLPRDYSQPRIDTVGQSALSVETMLLLLADVPGGALLVLSTDFEAAGAYDAWLREGIGALDIPQGVTVVQGGPRNVARLLDEDLVQPGADLAAIIAADDGLAGTGYLPRSLPFGGEAALPQTQPPLDITPLISDADRAAERALWEGAVALDTEAAYANYLQRYPSGEFAALAQEARNAILSEPNRAPRLAEEALQLSRDDRREIQRSLTLLAFNTRGIDGIFGPGTRGAITNWQQQNGFPQTGYITGEQIVRLEAQTARRAAEIEAEAARQQAIEIASDRAFWDETGAAGDEPGLRAYLGHYPDGLFADAARTRLATIEDERGRLAAAEEQALWQRAQAVDSAPGYRTYLDAYPQGSFANAAQARIEELAAEDDTATARAAARAVEQALGLNQLTRQMIEARLELLGLEPGTVDGEFDSETRRAIRRFQRDRGMERTGFLDEQSVVLLLAEGLQSP